jgi:hypothetical protein
MSKFLFFSSSFQNTSNTTRATGKFPGTGTFVRTDSWRGSITRTRRPLTSAGKPQTAHIRTDTFTHQARKFFCKAWTVKFYCCIEGDWERTLNIYSGAAVRLGESRMGNMEPHSGTRFNILFPCTLSLK